MKISKPSTNLPVQFGRKITTKIRNLPVVTNIPQQYRGWLREKAIDRARTRIIVAGGNPLNFSQDDLEVVVREEEDKIKSTIREKGLLAVLAVLGLNLFG